MSNVTQGEQEMSNVTEFGGVTTLDIPVARVLDDAPRDMDTVIIVGFDADGNFYFDSSKANGPDAMWLLQVAVKQLLQNA